MRTFTKTSDLYNSQQQERFIVSQTPELFYVFENGFKAFREATARPFFKVSKRFACECVCL